MSNGAECCALLICCPPSEQRAALVKIFCKEGCDDASAQIAADAIQRRFALAPKSFESVVIEIVAKAKKHAQEPQ
jgi:hypothetical protein